MSEEVARNEMLQDPKPVQESVDLWVDPASNTVKVDLFGGQYWVEIRKLLTAGQELAIQQAGVSFVAQGKDTEDEEGHELSHISQVEGVQGAKVGLNMARMNLAKALAYLVDWNFTAPNSTKPIPITKNNLEALNPRVFEAIQNAINEHATPWKKDGPPKQTRNGTGA